VGRIHLRNPDLAPGLPAATDALDAAESVLLISVRWWVADRVQGNDPLVRLRRALAAAGAPDAAYSVDGLMGVLARSTRRRIAIGCPRCPRLSDDERYLLHAAGLAQAGETGRAEETLRTSLLSAQGASFAMRPLEGLGELLMGAGLVFPHRAPPDGLAPLAEGFEA